MTDHDDDHQLDIMPKIVSSSSTQCPRASSRQAGSSCTKHERSESGEHDEINAVDLAKDCAPHVQISNSETNHTAADRELEARQLVGTTTLTKVVQWWSARQRREVEVRGASTMKMTSEFHNNRLTVKSELKMWRR